MIRLCFIFSQSCLHIFVEIFEFIIICFRQKNIAPLLRLGITQALLLPLFFSLHFSLQRF